MKLAILFCQIFLTWHIEIALTKPVHVFFIDNDTDISRTKRGNNDFAQLAIPRCVGYPRCEQSTRPRLPYKPPKCLCFYDKYGILCRPGCKRVMVIKKWKTYLPIIPQCEKLQNEGLPIVCAR